jgi:hypothetical protein
MIGTEFAGRYQMLASLGSGSTAAVFLARDTKLGRRVAVKVWLSAGPPPVAVPEVVGEARDAAVASLEQVQLEVTVVTQRRADCELGRVVSQAPKAGREAEVGSEVQIVVAAPPHTTTTARPTTTTTEASDEKSSADRIRDWFGSVFGGGKDAPSIDDAPLVSD